MQTKTSTIHFSQLQTDDDSSYSAKCSCPSSDFEIYAFNFTYMIMLVSAREHAMRIPLDCMLVILHLDVRLFGVRSHHDVRSVTAVLRKSRRGSLKPPAGCLAAMPINSTGRTNVSKEAQIFRAYTIWWMVTASLCTEARLGHSRPGCHTRLQDCAVMWRCLGVGPAAPPCALPMLGGKLRPQNLQGFLIQREHPGPGVLHLTCYMPARSLSDSPRSPQAHEAPCSTGRRGR